MTMVATSGMTINSSSATTWMAIEIGTVPVRWLRSPFRSMAASLLLATIDTIARRRFHAAVGLG